MMTEPSVRPTTASAKKAEAQLALPVAGEVEEVIAWLEGIEKIRPASLNGQRAAQAINFLRRFGRVPKLETDSLAWVLRREEGGNSGLWWRANSSGYTSSLAEAGHYTEEEARAIERSGGSKAFKLDTLLSRISADGATEVE